MLQDTSRTSMTVRALGGAAVLALIAGGSIEILPPSMRAMIVSGTLDSFLAVLPYTLGPALRVWAFWAIVTVVAGAALLRLAPELGALDAALAGAIVPWVFAYVGGNLLGPVGLFRSWTLWALVAGIAVGVVLIVATYGLGRSFADDVAGGRSARLLFSTILVKMTPTTMHGRTVAFVLAAFGVAFVLDPRRSRTRVVLGALALGTAVASHVI